MRTTTFRMLTAAAVMIVAAGCGEGAFEDGSMVFDESDLDTTLQFTAVADSFARSASPSSTAGSATVLQVDGTPDVAAYVRFDVRGISGTVKSARLMVYSVNASSNGPALHTTGSGWTESGLNWSNRPSAGIRLADLGSVGTGWISFDATAAVKADGSFDFVFLPTSTDGFDFQSRENTNKPRLVVIVSTPTAPVCGNGVCESGESCPACADCGACPPPIEPATTSGTLTFAPIADARVEANYPTSNFGTSSRLLCDASPGEASYLRFDVRGTGGAVQSARLRLFAFDGSGDGPAVYTTSSGWTESGLTWNNRPALGTRLADVGAVSSNSWVEFDVTAAVRGDGSYDFALGPTSSDGTDFYSRQGSYPPSLVVTLGSGSQPPPVEPPPQPTVQCGNGVCEMGESCTSCSGDCPICTDPILVGAGDIAVCGNLSGAEATAKLLDRMFSANPMGGIFTAGDNSNDSGTPTEYANCFNPTWGRHKARIRPTPGNHDYVTSGAGGYFGYYGSAAGQQGKGYYSYDLGSWHVVALNGNCSAVGGCGAGSPQEQWLRADLAASQARCTVAYWHQPRFSSGSHGSSTAHQPLWQALYDYGAELVMNGHDHHYERFAPQTPSGAVDSARGIRQFVVGTGGASQRTLATVAPNSEVRNSGSFGVLKLTLRPSSYEWEFVPIDGKTFTDRGSQPCH